MTLHRIRLCIVFSAIALGTATDATLAAELQPDQWFRNPLQWSFQADTVRSLGSNAGFAVLQAAPISTCVSVEADVEVSKVVGESWKIAGVAIVDDEQNFWHFAVVLPPASLEQRGSCELTEMRNSVWLSQNNLRVEQRESLSEPWKVGQRYRMRIAMDPSGIEGTLTDQQGRVLERVRYAFSAEAVKSGRPALHCNGFEAAFSKISIKHSEPAPTPPSTVAPYESNSFVKEVSGKKTGFFHVEQQGDTWWTIDPQGRGFVPLGVDHASFDAHWCEKLGYAPYAKKNQAKYDSRAIWAEETLGRLRDWGFNLLGAGCSRDLFHHGVAHTEFVAIGASAAGMGDALNIMPDQNVPGSAFPNVFHPDFEAYCRYRAQQSCGPYVGDPWLFGYFLDNELAWWGKGNPDAGLFDAVMQKSADHTAKRALRDFMAQRYKNDIAGLNRAWGVQLDSFDRLLQLDGLYGSNTEAVTSDKKAFIALIADRYFGTLARAIRSVDPDHMIIGCRLAGGVGADGVWEAAGRHCDIVSFNYYGNVDLDRGLARDDANARLGKPLADVFQKFYDVGRRPMMVTEWSFPATDAGLPSIHGAGQRFRTQAERAKATEITARTMLALPFMVGYDYFMWVDEPALGISEKFPEDSNYGLVNEDGRPYELLTTAFTRVHEDAGRLRREGLSRAGVVTSDSTPPSSPLAQFFAKKLAVPVDGAKPHPSLRFERKGDDFVATNGPMEIRGRTGAGGLTSQVLHRGLAMGRFDGMIQQLAGQNEWVGVERLVDVQATVGPTAMTLDLIGRYDAPPQSPRHSFEIAYRLTLLPDCDWFAAQWLWCRNTSDQPMDVRGIYFRLYSQIGGAAPDKDWASHDAVPRLWGDVVGDAWLSAKADAFWGFVAGDIDPLQIYFWADEGGQHPDARFVLERQLSPDETYRPAKPVGMLCVAGRGDLQQWQVQARKAIDSIGSP